MLKYSYSNNERQQMTTIEHVLRFVTEVDETNPTGAQLLALDKEMQIEMLERMLKEMVAPMLQETLDEINAGGSWAILKVAN
jgi:hypothetical protein